VKRSRSDRSASAFLTSATIGTERTLPDFVVVSSPKLTDPPGRRSAFGWASCSRSAGETGFRVSF
jgi:hypothetical protein